MQDGLLVMPNNGPKAYRDFRPQGVVVRVWCNRRIGSGYRGHSYVQVDWKWNLPPDSRLLVGRRTQHHPESLDRRK